MKATLSDAPGERGWTPTADASDRFSSGIPDFDRLLGGGFRRGSFALFDVDETVTQDDLDLVFFPTILNLLYQSRGLIAVLPSRDSPHGFRSRLTRHVSRRRFDTRVRIVDYVGEDEGAPYVVTLKVGRSGDRSPAAQKRGKHDMEAMVVAERAAQGQRRKSFLQLTAFEILDIVAGTETATKMAFHGVKRVRQVGNLLIGLVRPGLGCESAVRAMADTEFALHHDEVGLLVSGVHPAFPSHVVTADSSRGLPRVELVPRPG